MMGLRAMQLVATVSWTLEAVEEAFATDARSEGDRVPVLHEVSLHTYT